MNTLLERKLSASSVSGLVLATFSTLPLFALYLLFVLRFYPLLLSGAELASEIIFVTLLIRALLFSFFPGLKKSHPTVKLVVLSLELLVLVGYLIAFALTSGMEYLYAISIILPAWIASSMFIAIPFFIFEFGKSVYKRERLLVVLSTGALLLLDCIFAANYALLSTIHPSNLVQLGAGTFTTIISNPNLVTISRGFSSSFVIGAGVVFYISMVTYVSVLQINPEKATPGKYVLSLLAMLAGNAALVGWVSALLGTTTNLFWILSVPGIFIPLFLLVGFYGRKEKA